MAGKWIIAAIIASSLIAGYVLYGAFKKSPNYKSLVTEQLKMEFFDYSATIKKVSKLPLTTENSVNYYVDIDPGQKEQWKFEIQDKTLFVQAPALMTDPANQPLSESSVKTAQKTLEDFLSSWLEDKFHTKKDLLVHVRFKNAQP